MFEAFLAERHFCWSKKHFDGKIQVLYEFLEWLTIEHFDKVLEINEQVREAMPNNTEVIGQLSDQFFKFDFKTGYPQHQAQLAAISVELNQMSPKVIKKVYEVIRDPSLVKKLLKLAVPQYRKKEVAQQKAPLMPQNDVQEGFFSQELINEFMLVKDYKKAYTLHKKTNDNEDQIFGEMNQDKQALHHVIDLHGQYPKAASRFTHTYITNAVEAMRTGELQPNADDGNNHILKIICGIAHPQKGEPNLVKVVQELLDVMSLEYHLVQKQGVFLVRLIK